MSPQNVLTCIFCGAMLPIPTRRGVFSKYEEHLQDWHNITIYDEVKIALQRSQKTIKIAKELTNNLIESTISEELIPTNKGGTCSLEDTLLPPFCSSVATSSVNQTESQNYAPGDEIFSEISDQVFSEITDGDNLENESKNVKLDKDSNNPGTCKKRKFSITSIIQSQVTGVEDASTLQSSSSANKSGSAQVDKSPGDQELLQTCPQPWYEAPPVVCAVCDEVVLRSKFYTSHIRTHSIISKAAYVAQYPDVSRSKVSIWECLACSPNPSPKVQWTKGSIVVHLRSWHDLTIEKYEQIYMGIEQGQDEVVMLVGSPVTDEEGLVIDENN